MQLGMGGMDEKCVCSKKNVYFAKLLLLLLCRYMAKYGRFFGTFLGRTPLLIIGDPELLRQYTIKEFSHFINRNTVRFIKSMTFILFDNVSPRSP
jgi:hypothetical protein